MTLITLILKFSATMLGMNVNFDQVLQHAVAPIVLISGVGLILLSLNTRYSSSMTRTRFIINELSHANDQKRRTNLKSQVTILLKRCGILRLSIAMVIASTVFSSLIVLIAILAAMLQFKSDSILMGLLFLSCIFIMGANLLFFWDIVISLQALKLEIKFSLNSVPENKVKLPRKK